MADVSALLALPFATLVVLGCGYIGYRLAFIGRDISHHAVDVVFRSVAFAAVAQAVLLLFPGLWVAVGAPVALAVTASAAIAWRCWGAPRMFTMLRDLRISDHDGCATVWQSMLARKLSDPTRLVVKLRNGSALMCSDLRPFHSAPMGPCLFGEDGSVAMYVTDNLPAGREDWIEVQPYYESHPELGYEMSFVPASEIARIDVSRP